MSPELRALIVLAWVFFVAVLRALVSTRQAGRARSNWAVAAFGVACVPLAAGFVWRSPVVDSMGALGLLVSSTAIFGGLFWQDELTLRAERLEDQAAEEAERKRSQREADLRWYEQELSRVEGKLKELTSREAERRGMWCFWRRWLPCHPRMGETGVPWMSAGRAAAEGRRHGAGLRVTPRGPRARAGRGRVVEMGGRLWCSGGRRRVLDGPELGAMSPPCGGPRGEGVGLCPS
ncbi:hypothetical protein [Micrococcus sp. HSID17245]|uniref:hypothetical protein n=1 Tax=Micrococcus sp. HSID17245 TaxID=2419508 RepID=UPI000F86840D|nr:hypothetical protein [Micrococcus sp. HSID17245]